MRAVRPGRNKTMTIAGLGLAVLTVLVAWAWIDGGREPLHEIAVPVSVPDGAR